MAAMLYRLGRVAYHRRRLVLVVWALVLVTAAGLAGAFSRPANDQFSLPGTESQQAIDLLQSTFPGAGGAQARIVFAAPDGERIDTAANRAAVEAVVAEAGQAPQVAGVIDPFDSGSVSPDGRIAYATVAYTVSADVIDDASRTALLDTAGPARAAGLTVEYGGEAVQSQTSTGATEGIGVAVAVVVLAITFGSFLAAGMPLLTALFGIGVGLAGITAAGALVDMNSTAPILALMIGLAVGIDYALFIVSRHRQQLQSGMTPEESVARATATAGSAVVFAGLTVVIALAGLSVVGIPFLTVMGLAAAATVVVAVLVAVTLLPALLGFAGTTIDRLRVPGLRPHRSEDAAANGLGMRWSRLATRRPVATVVACLAVLGVLAIPAASLRLGLPDDGQLSTDQTQRRAYDLLSEGFGPGFNGPLTVVVHESAAGPGSADASGSNVQEAAARVAAGLRDLPDVATVADPTVNEAGDTAIVAVVPGSGPNTSQTKDLVGAIRDRAPALEADTGTDVMVTGNTAMAIDVSDKLADALPEFIVVIVGLAILLLTLVFRSILVPVKAAVGFLLSIAASFGAVVAVFQWGWLANLLGVSTTGPIVSFLPVLLIGVLFGLAMDYEVFLVSRMREEFVHTGDAGGAVVQGFRHGARVVTAAALIMVSVFAGFVLGHDPIVTSIGFALAFGVAVDAFIVRMTLVPAVMALAGRRAWWLPRWLDRLLPNLDIEGERLAPVPAAGADARDRELQPVP